MKIISYKYFSNPTDFENWQKKDKPGIINISSATSNGDVQNNINWDCAAKPIVDSTLNFNLIIFVTFFKEVSDD